MRFPDLYRWHRRAGAVAAAFLLLLLVTGIPLQFSSSFGLGQRYVTWSALLDWYGLEAPAEVRASGGVVSVGDRLFLAATGEPVGALAGFRGAVTLHGFVAAAGADEVLLLEAGQTEPLDRFQMPAPVIRIGRYQDRLAVETARGIELADQELVNFESQPVPAQSVAWSHPYQPEDAAAFRIRYRQRMLTVERLLQDTHSGRLLGTPGTLAVSLASLLLGFLAVSGLVMWWQNPRR